MVRRVDNKEGERGGIELKVEVRDMTDDVNAISLKQKDRTTMMG